MNPVNSILKRTMDILGACFGIVIASPVMLVCAILVKATSEGPVIFKQERVGLHNKVFRMYKFRTMEVQKQSAEENAERMTEELENVKTGQVTYAVRDTVIDDKEIKQGDYMGIGDKSILAVGKDIKSTTEDMVAEMVDEESAIICIYYGEEVTEEDANALGAALEEKYPEVEVEIHFGGQPIYYYVISVE